VQGQKRKKLLRLLCASKGGKPQAQDSVLIGTLDSRYPVPEAEALKI
jgi:hypothetical protein